MPIFYAHSGLHPDLSDGQLLRDHLKQVAELAQALARGAYPGDHGLAEAAYMVGLLHDLGKYRPEFQLMLKGLHARNASTWHKQAGTVKAAQMRCSPAPFVILGHHGGLPDRAKLRDAIADPENARILQQVWPPAAQDCPPLALLGPASVTLTDPLQAELFTRLLFSCLVDADWQDTGEHERQLNGWPQEPPPPALAAGDRLTHLLANLQVRASQCRQEAPVIAAVRAEVLQACLEGASLPPGLFSLTVPTGGGKTLSSLAFALRHAQEHGLRRVVYVAPYLTILEQNARAIREALGIGPDDPTVLEHHTLAEPPGDGDQNDTRRDAATRRAECWDASIVITTNVQFFESLFSNKPGRCRKLHNIAGSVILLDECQTLPPDLVAPTCAMLGELTRQLGCSIVLCTATQPAFEHSDMRPEQRLQNVREIIPEGLDLFHRLRRVIVEWPTREQTPWSWATVAERMRASPAALCVVNTKRAARELFAELKRTGEDSFHLSTSMCPAHRLMVLDEVRARLRSGRPCFLVSTQLIEAGVDVDFPLALRELAPLEAVIQAAGRCNREGKLNGPNGAPGGRVVVFRSEEGGFPPDRWYKAGRAVVETSFLNHGREPRIEAPEDISEYFERLYRTGDLDEKQIHAARLRYEFATVAKDYRLIDDAGISMVVATWAPTQAEVDQLLDMTRRYPTRANFRKLAPFQVQCRPYEMQQAGGAIVEERPGLFVWRGGYDPEIGLTSANTDALLLV